MVNLAFPADYRIKLKESQKRNKYIHLARELNKLWNINMSVITTEIGALDTVTKGLVQWLED